MNDTELTRQNLDLEFLGGTLTNAGIPNLLTPQSEEYALPFLSLEIGVAEGVDPAYVQLMYIPSAEILEETNLLQFFAYLPEVKDATVTPPADLIYFLNTRTALGYFGYDGTGKLFYRYVCPLARFAVPAEKQFLEMVDLYCGTLTVFGDKLCQFQRGTLSEQDLRQSV